MKFKWTTDKNNFLGTLDDHNILWKLSQKEESTVVELYTKFIYVEVLKRFNRFFTIKKIDMPMSLSKGQSTYQYYSKKTYKDLIREN